MLYACSEKSQNSGPIFARWSLCLEDIYITSPDDDLSDKSEVEQEKSELATDNTVGSWELQSGDLVMDEINLNDSYWDQFENVEIPPIEDSKEHYAANRENFDNYNAEKTKQVKKLSLRKKMKKKKEKKKHGVKVDLNKEEHENDRKEREKIREKDGRLVCINCNKLNISRYDKKKARAHAIHCGEGTRRKPNRRLKIVQCAMCEQSFASLVEKNKHHEKVHNTIVYKCTTCGKQFKKRAYLTRHIIVKHTSAEKPFKCGTCRQRFHEKFNMKTHEIGCPAKLPKKIPRTELRPADQGLQENVVRQMGTAWKDVVFLTHNRRLDFIKVAGTKLKLLTSHHIPFTIIQVIAHLTVSNY